MARGQVGEEPVQLVAARLAGPNGLPAQGVAGPVVDDRGAPDQLVRVACADAVAQVGDALVVADVGPLPLGQQGAQGREVIVEAGGALDEEVAVGATGDLIAAGAANEDAAAGAPY